jgi:hypothetical protein
MTDLSGHEVVQQARDNSITNTDPAMVRGAVVGIVTAVGSILVIGGYISEDQKQALADNAGVIVPALFAIAAVVQAIWTRMSVYSPRTAAKIAVANAVAPAGSPPTLAPPP